MKDRFEKAKSILLPLAEKNNAEAQLLLGYLFYGGDFKMTLTTAGHWLKKSARNGNVEAMAMVAGVNFREGAWWVSQPSKHKWLAQTLKAAKKGSAEAQRSLACAYAHGEIVPRDYLQTMYWDEKAAEQGLAEFQNDLALMLLDGMRGEPDIEKAIYWYEQSASKDHNVPHAEWAAEALANIYTGDPEPNLADRDKSNYWKKRAEYLSTLDYRAHPDWFYK